MRIVFIGCVQSSNFFLQELLNVDGAEIVGIVTQDCSNFNADFFSLVDLAMHYDIPYFLRTKDNENMMQDWVGDLHADYIYCFGWSHMLSKRLIQSARLGAVGYHPAKLPANRGRHPIIWALALGLKTTASTFFFLDDMADNGDIISQVDIEITDADDANTLYEKLMRVGKVQVRKFTNELMTGAYQVISQDQSKANNWRKRTFKDGIIDWRMPARGIYNLVRALAKPYVGACFMHQNQAIKVWKSIVVSEKTITPNLEPGRILSIESDGVTIQCGIGCIKLLDYDEVSIAEGECLL